MKLKPGILPRCEVSQEYRDTIEAEKINQMAVPKSWSNCCGSEFKVRAGPDYHVHGNKSSSEKSLFEVIAMDLYRTPRKVQHIGRFVDFDGLEVDADKRDNELRRESRAGKSRKSRHSSQKLLVLSEDRRIDRGFGEHKEMPDLPEESEPTPPPSPRPNLLQPELPENSRDSRESEASDIPSWFIINVLMPDYAPSMFRTQEDGEGYSLVFYARQNRATRRRLSYIEDTGPALRLLSRFINHKAHSSAEPEDEIKVRQMFKIIGKVMNVDHTDFSVVTRKMVTSYNAKPFLARTTTSFFSGPGYFEVCVDAHRFGYPARYGLSCVKGSLSTMVTDYAFVIQSEENDEMPERILCAARMAKILPEEAPDFPEELLLEAVSD